MRRVVVSFIGAIALVAAGCGSTSGTATTTSPSPAVAWPPKTITLIADSGAGSPKDVLVRQMAKALKAENPSWNVVVEDKVGGDGAASLSYLLSQPADGATWEVESASFVVALDTSLAKSFSASQFDFVAQTDQTAFVLAVNAKLPIHSMKELIAYSKSHRLTVSGFGQDSLEHYSIGEMGRDFGFKYTWVPYSSGLKATTAAVGGSADAVIVDASAAAPFIKKGELTGIAVTSSAPLSVVANVPTVVSLGQPKDVTYIWHGVFVKKGTPKAVVNDIDKALQGLPNNPAYASYMKSQSVTWDYQGESAFNATVQKDAAAIKSSLSVLN